MFAFTFRFVDSVRMSKTSFRLPNDKQNRYVYKYGFSMLFCFSLFSPYTNFSWPRLTNHTIAELHFILAHAPPQFHYNRFYYLLSFYWDAKPVGRLPKCHRFIYIKNWRFDYCCLWKRWTNQCIRKKQMPSHSIKRFFYFLWTYTKFHIHKFNSPFFFQFVFRRKMNRSRNRWFLRDHLPGHS